jgi:hypothetical protein
VLRASAGETDAPQPKVEVDRSGEESCDDSNKKFEDLRDAQAEQEFDGAAIGIDLGTTKSCIAAEGFDDGEVVCERLTVDEPDQPEGQIACPRSWR